MFTNIIKEACKNTKNSINCKCCFNAQPFKLPQTTSRTSGQLHSKVVGQTTQVNRIRPFYMS